MKSLFFLLFLIPLQGSAQSYRFNTSAGLVSLNENYINIPPIGVQRIKLLKLDNNDNIYSWTWSTRDYELTIEVNPGKVFLVQRKDGKIIQTIRIFSKCD